MRQSLNILISLVVLLSMYACGGVKAPEWTLGKSALYPAEHYLTGVGFDRDRARAEDRARGEIAKTFQVEIQARETSAESHWLSRAGEMTAMEYNQTVEAELVATTDKVLQGVQIAEVWQDEKSGEYYALAVLDRLRASRALHSNLNELDQNVVQQVRLAKASSSPLRRLGHYLQALKALDRRSGIAADLRVVSFSGRVADPPYSSADISAGADQIASGIRIGVELEDDVQGIVKGSLVRALAGMGIQAASESEQNLVVRGSVYMQNYSTDEPWQWSIATAQVEFLDDQGRVFDALRTSSREGSRVEGRSEILARERLGEKLAGILVEQIVSLGLVQQ